MAGDGVNPANGEYSESGATALDDNSIALLAMTLDFEFCRDSVNLDSFSKTPTTQPSEQNAPSAEPNSCNPTPIKKTVRGAISSSENPPPDQPRSRTCGESAGERRRLPTLAMTGLYDAGRSGCVDYAGPAPACASRAHHIKHTTGLARRR